LFCVVVNVGALRSSEPSGAKALFFFGRLNVAVKTATYKTTRDEDEKMKKDSSLRSE
jgi:hypothetical protein